MGLFSDKKNTNDAENKSSKSLADDAIKDLNCQAHMEKYRQCMMTNMNTPKMQGCMKILDEFRYCLVYKEQKEGSKPTTISNKLLNDK